jgi:hypothetical protein
MSGGQKEAGCCVLFCGILILIGIGFVVHSNTLESESSVETTTCHVQTSVWGCGELGCTCQVTVWFLNLLNLTQNSGLGIKQSPPTSDIECNRRFFNGVMLTCYYVYHPNDNNPPAWDVPPSINMGSGAMTYNGLGIAMIVFGCILCVTAAFAWFRVSVSSSSSYNNI